MEVTNNNLFNCRPGCGACCIAPSISSSIPGMKKGKKAGERCSHLTDQYKCDIFNSPLRPVVCKSFKPELLICGNSREEAMQILYSLE
jgi:uncharacterized protein